MTMWKNIFSEARKQLTAEISYKPQAIHTAQREATNAEIEKAIFESKSGLVFVLGPYGSGRTSQIGSFLQKHPDLRVFGRSFEKIESLDFAYLNLTTWWKRLLFVGLALAFTIFANIYMPQAAVLPFMLVVAYFLVKNMANLVYIFHEAFDNVFRPKVKVVVIEGLERSSLSQSVIWVFLANLWHYKRVYLISLGYAADDVKEKQKVYERAMKLNGTIIEIKKDEQLNYQLMRDLSPNFPFKAVSSDKKASPGWFSLFTPGEMILMHERILLERVEKNTERAAYHICLEHLLSKLELKPEEVSVTERRHKLQVLPLKELPSEKKHYLESFATSFSPSGADTSGSIVT